MKQAGTDTSGKWMGVEHAEKFAQLIVWDCVMCMYRSGVEGFGILEERMLKEHFGVEE
jgi:hypothetical protein